MLLLMLLLFTSSAMRPSSFGSFRLMRLLNGALQLQEALAELFARQFVDRAQTAIAQVVDVVHVAFTGGAA